MNRYDRWLEATKSVEGFFMPEAAAAWDVLLEAQRDITGALWEIGVYHGKSAALLALHTGPSEQLFLVDSYDYEEARFLERLLDARQTTRIIARSSQLPRMADRVRHVREIRWFHVDGEHTGPAVVNDLRFANDMLHDHGVVCIDDFFSPMYPQITASTFAFLATHPHELTLFLCGHNKGYLCRPTAAPRYLDVIGAKLVAELAARGHRNVTVFKTTTSSDMQCFGIGPRWKDFDYYGLDTNPATLPR